MKPYFRAVTPLLCLPLYAQPQVQQVLGIPSQLGQQIESTAADAQGNVIVAAVVTPVLSAGAQIAVNTFALIKKVDANGNEIFSRLSPGAPAPPLNLSMDNEGNIYVTGQTFTPDEFPFTNLLCTGCAYSFGNSVGFIVKMRGADGSIVYATSNPTFQFLLNVGGLSMQNQWLSTPFIVNVK